MQLIAFDTLVASWVIQLALGTVFLLAIWGMAYAFKRMAVAALAGGWTMFVLYIISSLGYAISMRDDPSGPLLPLLGALEGIGLIGMFAFSSRPRAYSPARAPVRCHLGRSS